MDVYWHIKPNTFRTELLIFSPTVPPSRIHFNKEQHNPSRLICFSQTPDPTYQQIFYLVNISQIQPCLTTCDTTTCYSCISLLKTTEINDPLKIFSQIVSSSPENSLMTSHLTQSKIKKLGIKAYST